MSLSIYLTADTCPMCERSDEISDFNITHNLGLMAEEAGIYGVVWRPEENGIESAGQLIKPLTDAIEAMKSDPERFKAHNPPNGWGNYDGFLAWLESYLEVCEVHPTASIRVQR